MKNSVWKLSALAGVVVLGFLVVLQTQFGLTRPAEELQAGQKDGKTALSSDNDKEDLLPSSHLALAGQSEPSVAPPVAGADEPKSEETQAVSKLPAEGPPRATGARTGNGSLTGGNPFADGSAKTPAPSPSVQQTTAAAEPVAKSAGPSFGPTPKTPFPSTNTPAIESNDKATPIVGENTEASDKTLPPNFGELTEPKSNDEPTTNHTPQPVADGSVPDGSFGKADVAKSPFSSGEKQPPSRVPSAETPDNPFSVQGGLTPATSAPKAESTPIGKSPSATPLNTTPPGSPFGETKSQTPFPPNSTAPAPAGPQFGDGNAATKTVEPISKSKEPSLPRFDLEPTKAHEKPQPATDNKPSSPNTNTLPTALPKSSGTTPSAPAPKKLTPAPEAAQLPPTKAESLSGDGTIGEKTPLGRMRAHLTIEKNAPKTATFGQPFVYDIIIKNVGTSPATQVVVEDQVPKGSRLTGTAPQAILVNKRLRWKLGTLQPNDEKKISVRIVPITAGRIGSVATVNFVSHVAAATTIKKPTLDLKFTGPSTSKLGETVSFRFVVTNTGPDPAKDVWIRNIIPDGLQHAAGKDLEFEVGILKPGESKTVVLKMKTVKAGTATSRGIITATGGLRVESQVVVEIVAPRLVISRTGPKQRYVGRAAIYTNMVTNDSTKAIRGAKLTEVIPAGMEFIEATGGGQYDPSRRLVAWEIGSLDPKQSRTFRVKLMSKEVGKQKSVVRAYTQNGNVVQTGSETAVAGYSRLGLDIASLDRPVEIGEEVTLRVVARNRGTAAATDVEIRVELPQHLKLVSVRGSGKYTQKGGEVLFTDLPVVAPGGKAEYEIVAKAVTAADVRVKVQIQSKDMQRPLKQEEAIRIVPAKQ